ncbi:hypothetical protein T03_8281 [Trichinella britovi]|uniref:Uncharacterized protein n=1 Tax=Trichinella britovi TaxID=45882 RepID=A0A0V1C7P4_TRIBR|nr:hypothetical protein T03_8281 [Trichinella britovi]
MVVGPHRHTMNVPKLNFCGRKPLLLEILEQGFQLTRRPNIYDFETPGQAGRPAEAQLGKSGRNNPAPGCWESCLELPGSRLFRNRTQISPVQVEVSRLLEALLASSS